LQERMIKKAVENHFKLEKELLTQKPRIKPLTLFFIDNIKEYRNEEGYLRNAIESYIKAMVKDYLKNETDEFYKKYLEKTFNNIRQTHGGYFSKDNTESDEAIEKEVNEILHDKESLLELNNPRRFIFSKWTLREGWDNPNVFQICKLRSSGSEISKLQEVGRGLRLPVNEYMSRVKDKQFYLHYYVDFTESDFVDKLVNEINEKSNAISMNKVPKKLMDEIIKKILEVYPGKFKDAEELLETLDNEDVIKRDNTFKGGGFNYIRQNFPLIFEGLGSNKIRKATDQQKKVKVRIGKYNELKGLWEELNQKAILEYKIDNEEKFKELFKDFLFLNVVKDNFQNTHIRDKKVEIRVGNNRASAESEYILNNLDNIEVIPIITMSYHQFIKELAKVLHVNIKTLHDVFKKIKNSFDINKYLNISTIRFIKHGFNNYLLYNAINKFEIAYQKVSHFVHPTKLTDSDGKPLEDVEAADFGVMYSDEKVADNYYFEELFYDSDLEKENIKTEINEVIVFTKIPKNSIKIPVAGGGSYTPDFAYVLKAKDGQKKLYFVVETKNIDSNDELRKIELQKIKHAEKFFGDNIKFETQFSSKKIADLIKEIYHSTN